jgi:AcrR family transcriptional regulator
MILDAALRLFRQHPYEEIFTDDIAREAGVANGLLFYYFGDKRGLYTAAVQRQVEVELDLWRRTRHEGETTLERIHSVVYEHFEYLEANPHTFLGMMRRSPSTPDVEPIFEAARQESTEIILGHLGLDIQLDPLGSAVLRGWAAFNDETTVALLTGDDLNLDQVTQLSMTMLLAALRTLTDRYPDVDRILDELQK